MPQWTKEQLAAITTRGESILVSAAAGSGKTAVLVERVCHYLVNLRQDVERLLVVTFTEAAAAEMRQRIAAALRERLEVDPHDRHLVRQFALLEQAHISTIHSFCLWLLRRFFYRLDLDPAFRVMDEGEDRLFKLEVLDQLLEEHYEAEQPGSPFYELADRYGGQNGLVLQELALRLHDFSQSQVFPQDWLRQCAEAFKLPAGSVLEETIWYEVVADQARADVQNAIVALREALRLIGHPYGPHHYRRFVQSDLGALQDLQQVLVRGGWDEACQACARAAKFAAARAKTTNEVDAELLERVQQLRNEAKKAVGNLATTVYTRPAEQMMADLGLLAGPAETLAALVHEFGEVYSESKRARGLVSFSDLEQLSLQLLLAEGSTPQQLIPSATAGELQECFTEVLCDEYQDINPVQNALISLVAGELGGRSPGRQSSRPAEAVTGPGANTTTFMVGDVKQSIYRFRLAEPQIFLQRADQAARGAHGHRIDLAANFRCRLTVVEGVNYLFRRLMSQAVGDVEYHGQAELVYSANYPPDGRTGDPPVEVMLLEGAPRLLEEAAALGDDEDVDLAGLEREATLIARRVRHLVSGAKSDATPYLVWDKGRGAYRPVRYRDVVVLLRATQVKANQFVDIFAREGVPLYAETGSGYFLAPEVEMMLALLTVIDNPRQDVPLAGVLRSPLAGLRAADLADIRVALPEGEFYDAVVTRAEHDDELARRLQAFLRRLEGWRTRARRGSLAELIWLIYRDTGFYDFAGGMPAGGQRQANLRALYDRARQFDQFARQGLVRFLQFIADLRAAGQDLGTAPALGENEDVVRLMSIHKSKGLEFPVVFVAGLGAQFNQRDLVGSLLYDRKLGLGPQLVDPARHTRAHTLASLAVRENIRRAGLSEEMRILYVALTRARERLCLVATVKDLVGTLERWMRVAEAVGSEGALPVYQATTARSFSDWLGPVLCTQQGLLPRLSVSDLGSEAYEGQAPGWRAWVYPAAAVLTATATTAARAEDWAGGDQALGERAGLLKPGTEVGLSPPVRDRLLAQLNWTYPHGALGAIGAKTTVTELKRRQSAAEDPETPGSAPYRPAVFRRPRFLWEQRGLTAAEVGTATHLVLQSLPLGERWTSDAVAGCVTDLVMRHVLTAAEGEAVDQGAIVRFAGSPLGRQLQAAATATGRAGVWRELPFTLAIPATEAIAGTMAAGAADGPKAEYRSDVVILQGVVDCVFWGEGGWTLVDFKTDRLAIHPDQWEAEVRRRYENQMRWYALAMERILHITVGDCYLYLLTHSLAVRVDPRGVGRAGSKGYR